MSRAIVEEALALVGDDWMSPEERTLDADGCVELHHPSGLEVMLTYVPEPVDAIVLYAELGAAEDTGSVFRQALEAMHLWQTGDNLTLGVLPGTDELTACLTAPADEELLRDLPPLLNHFAERGLVWAGIVAGGSTDASKSTSDEGAVWG